MDQWHDEPVTENQPPNSEPSESSAQQPPSGGASPESNPAGQFGPPQYPHVSPDSNVGWGHSASSVDPAASQPWGHVPLPHPNSQVAFILGIVGLIGTVCCCFLFFLPPVAWVLGHQAVKAIDAQPHMYSGRDQARVGMILGMVGSAAAVLGVFVFFLSFGLEMLIEDW